MNFNEQQPKIRTKECTYGCGKLIYWNVLKNQYDELDTKQKHICPNMGKKDSTNTTSSYNKPKTSYGYNKNWVPKPKEEKPPVSNTFELLEGSPKKVRMQYQYLSDLIQKANGKVHGSQSHIVENGLKMLIYFEVPEGYRDNVHESFSQFIQKQEEEEGKWK